MGTRCHCMNTSSENMQSFHVFPLDVSCQGVNLKVTLAVNLKVTLAVHSANKLEGDSGSKLEGALLLGTRCHCMNTSSENMQSFHVFPLDVTCQGVNLKVTLAVNLKVTLAVNLKVTLAVAVTLKVPWSWLVGGKLELDTSSENMNSYQVLLLHHRGLFYKRPLRSS